MLWVLCCVLAAGAAEAWGPRLYALRHTAVGKAFPSLAASASPLIDNSIRGAVLVSGIGNNEEDEFFLDILHQKKAWDKIVLVVPSIPAAEKRFLSRTARYSGLLDVLEFREGQIATCEDVQLHVKDCSAWVAFDIRQPSIPQLAEGAVSAGIRRAVFTTTPVDGACLAVPEFTVATNIFSAVKGHFTGIRHGAIVPGGENFPYEIVNGTQRCTEDHVPRGVLGRVAAELVQLVPSFSRECALSASGEFAAAYLSVLRSAGLSRSEEVHAVFVGGMQRIARLTEERRAEASAGAVVEAAATATAGADATAMVDCPGGATNQPRGQPPLTALALAAQHEREKELERRTRARTEEILQETWRSLNGRMLTLTTPKSQFFDENRALAHSLAFKEVQQETVRQLQVQAGRGVVDTLASVEEERYSRLLTLERKELARRQQFSTGWVAYTLALLDATAKTSRAKGLDLLTSSPEDQAALLRVQVNALRVQYRLPASSAIYDPLDAAEIAQRLSADAELGGGRGDLSTEEARRILVAEYGTVLGNVVALKAAAHLEEVASQAGPC